MPEHLEEGGRVAVVAEPVAAGEGEPAVLAALAEAGFLDGVELDRHIEVLFPLVGQGGGELFVGGFGVVEHGQAVEAAAVRVAGVGQQLAGGLGVEPRGDVGRRLIAGDHALGHEGGGDGLFHPRDGIDDQLAVDAHRQGPADAGVGERVVLAVDRGPAVEDVEHAAGRGGDVDVRPVGGGQLRGGRRVGREVGEPVVPPLLVVE